MNLKIPPPLIALLFGSLMWGIASVDDNVIESAIIFPFSTAFLVIGLGIDIVAAITFRIANTTLNPMKPNTTTQLVKTGVFKFSRNPMYLGLLFILLSWTIWLGSVFNIAILFFFVWYITKFQIMPEEKALEVLFAEEFEAYKSSVRRWI